MSASAALPQLRRRPSHVRFGSVRLAELSAFIALATLIALAWGRIVGDAPVARIAVALVIVLIGAVAAQAACDPRRSRGLRPLAVVAPLIALIVAALVIGVPLRLLAPSGWSELSNDVRTGIRTLSNSEYPYVGSDEWARLVALVAIPMIGTLVAMLAFWKGPTGRRIRLAGLGLGLIGFIAPSIMNSAAVSLVDGAVLFCVICAWVWLPRVAGTGGRVASAVVAAVALISIPAVSALGPSSPILDYTNWDPFHGIADVNTAFGWDQTYGPIDWERDGNVMLKIESHGPHYWRTVVLDRFDGIGWSSSLQAAPPNSELPAGVPAVDPARSLNPDWLTKLRFHVEDLESDTVVGAGTILAVNGVEGAESDGGTRVTVPGEPLKSGDDYSVEAYVPDPTPADMRAAAPDFPSSLATYRTLSLPQPSETTDQTSLASLDVPAWKPGASADPNVEATIDRSPYARTYALAKRLTADSKTEYGAVQAISQHLKSTYDYSETPPARPLPLSAFLFQDRIGYCQQFSGSLALMLRLLGIPARVASGFAPGEHSANGEYQVSDLDAHAWVEVYFNDIGWVPFDPTPAASPAQRDVAALHAQPVANRVGPREFPGATNNPAPKPATIRGAGAPTASSSGVKTALIVAGAAILVVLLGAAALFRVRVRRYRAASPAVATESQLRELEGALARLGYPLAPGSTLIALERRLATVAGPVAAGYVARIREHRYAPGPVPGPTLDQRKRARQELASSRGWRRRVRAMLAMPPGAPSLRRQPSKR